MKICKNSDFRHFGRKKNFSKIGLGHVLGITITHLCAKNQKKLMMKCSRKCQKTGISGIFGWKKIFSKGRLSHILGIINTHLWAKNQKKTNDEISRKCQKNRVFRHIYGIFGRKSMFFKNQAHSHFRHCRFASVCKISWKI